MKAEDCPEGSLLVCWPAGRPPTRSLDKSQRPAITLSSCPSTAGRQPVRPLVVRRRDRRPSAVLCFGLARRAPPSQLVAAAASRVEVRPPAVWQPSVAARQGSLDWRRRPQWRLAGWLARNSGQTRSAHSNAPAFQRRGGGSSSSGSMFTVG